MPFNCTLHEKNLKIKDFMEKRCPKCDRSHPEEDFFGKDICFKCVWNEKKREKVRRCEICLSIIPSSRWTYCSKECAIKGHIIQRPLHWTKKISCNVVKW